MNMLRLLHPRNLSRSVTIRVALFLALTINLASAAEPSLQLKENDVWVMSGDSITAQRLHTNYIEAFYRARNPNMHLHFRNSGIGGNRTSSVLARFDYDVAAWKPTIVSVELGMNDVNGPVDAYINGMKELITKIRAIPAQPVLISSSPVDDGSLMDDWKSERCAKIHPFTQALKKLAEEEKVVFVDQYHPLIALWGPNRKRGAEAAAAKAATQPVKAAATPAPKVTTPTPASVAGAQTPAPPKAPPIPPGLIPLGGDTVHPGPVGQYTMAAVILKGLGASGEVSSATISATGKVSEAKRCKITDAAAKDGKLTFTRLDETGPWPIDPKAKSALQLLPEILKLSEYNLRVTGLADGDYRVSIDGKPTATVSAKDLAAGWNITAALDGALGQRSSATIALVAKLQDTLNKDWRAASKAKDTEKLSAAQKAIDECEAQIQAAIQPMALHFQIEK